MSAADKARNALAIDRQQALGFVQAAGVKKTRALLEESARDLRARLKTVEGSRVGPDSYTATQMRATLKQLEQVLAKLTRDMKGVLLEHGPQAAEMGAQGTAEYLAAADKAYKGVGSQPLALRTAAMLEAARDGSAGSILRRLATDPSRPGHYGVLQRYGVSTIGYFERELQKGLMQKKSWAQMQADITEKSPFLQGAPAFWAQRIVRTEMMAAHNRGQHEAVVKADKDLGGFVKILSAVFDDRTGCLVASTRVAGAMVRAVFRRWYEGPVTRLVTEAGRDLTATPNHPVLTRRGWVAAGQLHLGDELVCDGGKESPGAAGDEYVAGGPATIGEVFEALRESGVHERRRGSQQDFYGDGMNGEVDVLHPHRELRLGDFAPVYKPSAERVFAPSNNVLFCTVCGAMLGASTSLRVVRLGAAAQSHPGVTQTACDECLGRTEPFADVLDGFPLVVLAGDVFDGHLAKPGVVLSGALALPNAVFPHHSAIREFFGHVPPVDVQGVRHLRERHPRAVKFDRLVHIESTSIAGHVFDLSTTEGYFTAEGVYTGNCDSYAVHGQIRRPEEPFEWWEGAYMHPPNRPNDREVVVPHRIQWPIPPYLLWKDEAEVQKAWTRDGRKGAPPERPLMTTVPLSEFGKKTAQPASSESESASNEDHGEPEIPERSARSAQAAPEEAPWHDPGIPEIPERAAKEPMAAAEDAPLELPELDEPSAAAEPEPLTASQLMEKKPGEAKGSNRGGFYTGSDGVDRYVKFYDDPSQAYCEHLSNQLYRDLGLGAPESLTFDNAGKQAYASNILAGLKTVKEAGLTQATSKGVMQGFAADVLTGNWDAVGTGLDNVGTVDGKVVRVDNGGTLLFRAKAGRKPEELLNKITEWEKLLSPGANPYYAQVANKAGIAKAEDLGKELVEQIGKIDKLRKASGGWKAYVEQHAPDMDAGDKARVVKMLEERTKLLKGKVDGIKEATKQAKADAKLAKEAEKKAKADAKEQAKLIKKMGGLPPQTHGQLVRDDAAAEKHFAGHTTLGWGERTDYWKKADEAIREALPFKDGPQSFTGSVYGEIREHERNLSAPAEFRIQQHARDIREFMARAKPAPQGVIYRGITNLSSDKLDSILKQPIVGFDATTSTSRKASVSKDRFGGGMDSKGDLLFVIKHKTAVPVETISRHTEEEELLMKKGTQFRVTRRFRNAAGAAIIEMEEI